MNVFLLLTQLFPNIHVKDTPKLKEFGKYMYSKVYNKIHDFSADQIYRRTAISHTKEVERTYLRHNHDIRLKSYRPALAHMHAQTMIVADS